MAGSIVFRDRDTACEQPQKELLDMAPYWRNDPVERDQCDDFLDSRSATRLDTSQKPLKDLDDRIGICGGAFDVIGNQARRGERLSVQLKLLLMSWRDSVVVHRASVADVVSFVVHVAAGWLVDALRVYKRRSRSNCAIAGSLDWATAFTSLVERQRERGSVAHLPIPESPHRCPRG